MWGNIWCTHSSGPLVGCLSIDCVKRKSLIFFIWRKSLIFFFQGVSQVWKKNSKMYGTRLHFFCDVTYTERKSYATYAFFKQKKSQLCFFCYTTYAFFDTLPTTKKKIESYALKKKASYVFFVTRPTAKKKNTRFKLFFTKKRGTIFWLRDLRFF